MTDNYEEQKRTGILWAICVIVAVLALIWLLLRLMVALLLPVFLILTFLVLFAVVTKLPVFAFISGLFRAFGGLFFRSSSALKSNSHDRVVRITNARLKLIDGTELQVRIEGALSVGSIAPGDDVDVTGVLRGGTLMFARGYNRRTNSKLRRPLYT